MRKKPTIALMYDFDKTLCDQDMQNYTFIPNLGMTDGEFWGECEKFRKKNYMEGILGYMYYSMQVCEDKGIPFTKDYLRACGKDIRFFKGVQNWFERINQYGESLGVNIEHYVISSGIKEIIDGCAIKDEFKRIFACQYYFDENDKAIWPKIAINYTQKTQYIFRISKAAFDESDNKKVNDKMTDRIILCVDEIPCLRYSVFLRKLTLLHRFAQGRGGRLVPGVDHEAAHIQIQPVDGVDFTAQRVFQFLGHLVFRIHAHGLDDDRVIPVLFHDLHLQTSSCDSFCFHYTHRSEKVKKSNGCACNISGSVV